MNRSSRMPMVLVVAPQDELRHSLAFMLTAEGFVVRTQPAWSTTEIGVNGPDCVIMDEAAIDDNLKGAGSLQALGPRVILLVNRFTGRLILRDATQICNPVASHTLMNELRSLLRSGDR